MTGLARPVLRVGDRVPFDGGEHVIVGLAGTAVRLRAEAGAEQVVLAGHLMAAADFAVLDAAGKPSAMPAVEPFGLLEALPAEVVEAARRWREHVVEVETGAFAEHRRGGAMILFHRTMAPLFSFSRAALITSDTLAELDITASHLSSRQREALLDADYLRPEPAPTTWLDTAAEPRPWTNQTGPRHSYRDPLFPRRLTRPRSAGPGRCGGRGRGASGGQAVR